MPGRNTGHGEARRPRLARNSTRTGMPMRTVVGRAADDVREQPRPLLELDVGQHVGHGRRGSGGTWFWWVTVKV